MAGEKNGRAGVGPIVTALTLSVAAAAALVWNHASRPTHDGAATVREHTVLRSEVEEIQRELREELRAMRATLSSILERLPPR